MRNHNRRKEDLCSPTSPRPGSFKACPTVPVYHLCDCTSVPLSHCTGTGKKRNIRAIPHFSTLTGSHISITSSATKSWKQEMVLEFTLKSLTVTHISIKHPPGVGHPPHISRRYSVFRDIRSLEANEAPVSPV